MRKKQTTAIKKESDILLHIIFIIITLFCILPFLLIVIISLTEESEIIQNGYSFFPKKISFEAYNESTCLTEAVERFKERTGYYPKRVLADQIYRTRENRSYCKEHGIRLSGPKLGRPSATAKVDKKQEYQDNTDRIEVERRFSLSKRCYGMSCITTKLEETQLTSIALSVFVTNLFRIQRRILCALLYLFRFWCDWSRCKSWKLQIAA